METSQSQITQNQAPIDDSETHSQSRTENVSPADLEIIELAVAASTHRLHASRAILILGVLDCLTRQPIGSREGPEERLISDTNVDALLRSASLRKSVVLDYLDQLPASAVRELAGFYQQYDPLSMFDSSLTAISKNLYSAPSTAVIDKVQQDWRSGFFDTHGSLYDRLTSHFLAKQALAEEA